MDILIGCHCKEMHSSICIIDLKTLKSYRLMPVRAVDRENTSVEKDIKNGNVIELATPEILLDEFNIRSISYINTIDGFEGTELECKKRPDQFDQFDQFINWDDIGDKSFDKIITIYCDHGIDKTIQDGHIDRILRPNGDITIWGNRLKIPNFITTATKIEKGDNFLLGPYSELSKSKNYDNLDDFISYLNRDDKYFDYTTHSFKFTPNMNFTIQKRKSDIPVVPTPVVPTPVLPTPVVPNPDVPNPVVPDIPVFQPIKSNITAVSLTRDGKLIASAQAVNPPSKNDDETYAKPAGRQPKGYIWDRLKRFWAKESEKKGGGRKSKSKTKTKTKTKKRKTNKRRKTKKTRK